MKNSSPGIATAFVLAVMLGPSAASAAPVTMTGPTALAVAAVVARYSPLLNPGERKVIAGLFDGNSRISYPKKKLSVSADTVTCRISNVAIAERSCDIAFAKGKHSLKGREANEVYATLASAGVTAARRGRLDDRKHRETELHARSRRDQAERRRRRGLFVGGRAVDGVVFYPPGEGRGASP